MKRFSPLIALLLVAASHSALLAKSDVLAVLSSDLAPYEEAFAGFKEEAGDSVDLVRLARGPLKFQGQPRVIVTFGGKAAHLKYPDGSTLIYCMAPGTFVNLTEHSGPAVQVSMMPKPATLLAKLKTIQPGMKRLAVLWTSPSFEVYAKSLRREAPDLGVEIRAERLEKPDGLPARLRDWKNGTDALWLPPDPLLITGENIVVISQFSWSNHTPFYSAVPGLAEQGAVASLSSSYREIGRAAGKAAAHALQGKALPDELYPEATEVTVNAQSAAKAGLELPKGLPTGAGKGTP